MVRWSDQAKSDLNAIHHFIARDSKHYARKVVEELIDKTDLLNEFPRLGRIVPELGDENVREVSAYAYRILYEVIPPNDRICILAVVHKRRDLDPDTVGR